MIYIASDHGGYDLKAKIVEHLQTSNIPFKDLGPDIYDPEDDYNIYAHLLASNIQEGDLGILICRSGQGMAMTANKHSHVRAMIGYDHDITKITKSNDWANVLCIPADYLTPEKVIDIVNTFINTNNTEEPRHVRRVKGITAK